MWQRKQTIYLVLAVFLMVIAVFMTKEIVLQIASGVIALLSAVTIFLYNNRPLQSKMCMAGQLLTLAWVVYYGIVYCSGNNATSALQFELCLPVVTYVMFRMARVGIKHDEDLIRSADRIR